MEEKELASRIKSARESAGLSLTEAAKRLGFNSYQTLSNIENGERDIKASELAKIAKIYYRDLSYFLSEDLVEPTYSFLWRNPPQDENEKKEAEAKIFQKCEQYHLLEKLLRLSPEKGLIEISREEIRNNYSIGILANRVREILSLGSRPAFSLQKVLEQDYAIKILFLPLTYGSAVSLIHPQCGKAIVINATEPPWRQNFDLAHELFYLISWKIFPPEELKDSSLFEDMEKKAEKFASMLLLPENDVIQETIKILESQKKMTFSDLVDISMNFGVSTKALLYRYAYLKFLAWESADKIAHDEELAEISREKRYSEKDKEILTQRFITLAIKCLRKGLISRGKFAQVVEIDRSDIDWFIENRGMMESEGKPVEIMAS